MSIGITNAAERKATPVYSGFLAYFPKAIAAVARVSLAGGIQHGQTAETLHWDRSKSGDELDALSRHLLDGDWAQVAWRALSNLEKQIEKEQIEAASQPYKYEADCWGLNEPNPEYPPGSTVPIKGSVTEWTIEQQLGIKN